MRREQMVSDGNQYLLLNSQKAILSIFSFFFLFSFL